MKLDDNREICLAVIADLFEDENLLDSALTIVQPEIAELPDGRWQLSVGDALKVCKFASRDLSVEALIEARILISEMTVREDRLVKQADTNNSLLADYEQIISELEVKIDNLESEVDEAETELGWMESTKDDWESEANDLENELHDKESIIQEQQEEIEDLNMTIDELTEQITGLEEQVNSLEDELEYNRELD